jgi:ABC-type sugar transport system ATPase subunit
MTDRILVMRRGRMVAELNARATTQEEVLRHAAVDEGEQQAA